MNKQTQDELCSILNALDHFWRIETDKGVREVLFEVVQRLETVCYWNKRAAI